MYTFHVSQSILTFFTIIHTAAAQAVTAGRIPAENQTWGFGPDNRCRILAHKSVVLQNGNSQILVLDGGFGSFQTLVNGTNTPVLDLNPFTAAFDLSKDFSVPDLDPLWYYRKPYNSTQRFSITNHGGLWGSQDGKTIWYQGGHYYNADGWNDGLYHVDKSEIPEWQLWQMDVTKHQQGWKDVTNATLGHETANRTFFGVAASVPEMHTSFWLGGITDRTTSPSTPNTTILQTSSQMLVYNQTSSTITKDSYFLADSTDGYYQGSLVHLPIGGKSGYLMSLMSLKKDVNTPWDDPDGESGNYELAEPVSLDMIPMYDLETGQWFEQKTTWFNSEVPEPRTRFCSALFHDESDNSWSLWVHGGQLLSDQNKGVREIYVLSMPSFIWSKVETALADTNLIRSHTCHAVGSQLIIVGGYPPGKVVSTNVTCDTDYLKVLNIGEKSNSWTDSFQTNTKFQTPSSIRNVVNQRTTPISGFANAKLETDFSHSSNQSKGSKAPIAGGVVAGVVIIAVALGVFFWVRRRRANRRHAGGNTENGNMNGRSRSPNCVLPEVRTDTSGTRHYHGRAPMAEVREIGPEQPTRPNVYHELPSPTLQSHVFKDV